MSSAFARPLLLAALLVGLLSCGAFGFAHAAAVEQELGGQLVPSVAPSLLGPITSVGRKGWDCKPEHMAAATEWKQAELPAEPESR
ncbi:MAG: hypothetical protein JO092_05555 [Candidatus Eremiobacteraeota bacterium]|nr:hypothetical protein [Candidatus Eremiobacteraeota bacterium]